MGSKKVAIGGDITTLFRGRMTTLGINAIVESFLRGDSLEDFMKSSVVNHIFTPEAIEMINNRGLPWEPTHKPSVEHERINEVAKTDTTAVTDIQMPSPDQGNGTQKLVRRQTATGEKGIIISSDD